MRNMHLEAMITTCLGSLQPILVKLQAQVRNLWTSIQNCTHVNLLSKCGLPGVHGPDHSACLIFQFSTELLLRKDHTAAHCGTWRSFWPGTLSTMVELCDLQSDILWKSLPYIFAKTHIELARLLCCIVSCCCFSAVLYRESIIIGETNMSKQQIHALIQEMGNNYKGNLYHLLQRNCNHFSDELAFKLCKAHAPAWVSLPHMRHWIWGIGNRCCGSACQLCTLRFAIFLRRQREP